MDDDGFLLFSNKENDKTYALGNNGPGEEYCIHSILMERCSEHERNCKLIGSVNEYMILGNKVNGFQHVSNRFLNKTTGMIDIVTYYIFDTDRRVYKNVVSVVDESMIDMGKIIANCARTTKD
jgi:hypothetical protein